MANKKYSDEFINEVLKEYDSTGKKKATAVKFNVPLTTLGHWILNRNAVNVGNVPYSKEIKDEVISKYINGMYISELVSEYGIIEGTINSWIKPYARKRGLKSMCKNEDYFENIDSEMKAYWLGFIMADGNVSITNNQYSLKLHLQYRDRCMIERMLEDLDCSNAILDKNTLFKPTGKYHRSTYVSITSKRLVESLIKLGVTPNKTGKERLPEIKNDLKRHFIRGFFDGDGIACYTENSKGAGFVSNYDMLDDITFEIGGGWESLKQQPHWKTGYIGTVFTYSKEKLKHLYEYMYKDSSFYLERKHLKFVKMLS